MFEKELVIDGRAHVMGRLASIIAKQILNGQKVVVVRAEGINISGTLFRNKLKMTEYNRKTRRANPKRGHKHFHSPSRLFWRVVRGMLPRKTAKGEAAIKRLKVFEGIPYPWDHKKRMIIPQALKVLRLQAHRKWCILGDLARESCGWGKADVVARLEERRKAKSQKFYAAKQAKVKARTQAGKSKAVQQLKNELSKFGY